MVSLIVGVYAAACAADAGDPSKINSGLTTGGADGSIPGDDGAAVGDAASVDDSTTYAPGDGPPTMTTPETSTTPPPEDSGTPPIEDSGAPETAPPMDAASAPDVAVGAGCAAGATVIIATCGGGSTGNFGTLGAVCVQFQGNVNGWNASNVQGRTITATGSTTQMVNGNSGVGNQPGLSAGSDGNVYWNFSATTSCCSYASMSCW